ncbi:Metallo-dependent phosphatase [Neoconidiobolus thromboides FSU 785]|nr:Metallo-dependent phosphatase [Neoconidiobolus thromboides FSU 785]
MILFIYLTLISIFHASTRQLTDQYSNPIRSKLRLNKHNKFIIITLADLHYGEEPSLSWGPEQDFNSTRAINRFLDLQDPELVVFTGDQLTGEFMFKNYTKYVKQFTKPLRERGIKWSSVYGNHDIGPNVQRERILEEEQRYFGSYTKKSDKELEGVGNYLLKVYDKKSRKKNKKDKLKMLMYFLDSRGGYEKEGEPGIPMEIGKNALKWLETSLKFYKLKDNSLPILLFFHVPTIQFHYAKEKYPMNCSLDALNEDGVTPQDNDTGLFNIIKNYNVKGLFVGHDHGINWCCKYENINLCFCPHSGYGGYGTWERGIRIIELDYSKNGPLISTYNQFESGKKSKVYYL